MTGAACKHLADDIWPPRKINWDDPDDVAQHESEIRLLFRQQTIMDAVINGYPSEIEKVNKILCMRPIPVKYLKWITEYANRKFRPAEFEISG